LEQRLEKQSTVFADVMKSGRTHHRDAVPITLGMELHAYASAVREARLGLQTAEGLLRRVPLGATAVGTGVNTHERYSEQAIGELRWLTSLDLAGADDPAESLQFTRDFLVYADALAALATILLKIDNDLMLLSSGPATGLGEISIPPVEPGSSIMPGKVNPSILECVNMVCLQAIGSRVTVEAASTQGSLELNVYTPVIAFNVLSTQRWMAAAVSTLNNKCVAGLVVNKKATDYYFEHSNALATLLSPVTGYEVAAKLAREAVEKGETIRKVAIDEGLATEAELDELARSSTGPNLDVVERLRRARKSSP
jgi:fumarate hydratase class II